MPFDFRINTLVLIVLAAVNSHSEAQNQPPVLDAAAQLMLVRNTIALVNHGNLTGNYTVLRDLASESFRHRNTAGDLAGTFANLRQQKLDLSPALVIEPQLAEPPREIAPGRLQMIGHFPTRPQAVQFALVYQRVGGGWLIDEVSLRVAPAEIRGPSGPPNPSPAPPPVSYPPSPPLQLIRSR